MLAAPAPEPAMHECVPQTPSSQHDRQCLVRACLASGKWSMMKWWSAHVTHGGSGVWQERLVPCTEDYWGHGMECG
jgi:hypothetical protein